MLLIVALLGVACAYAQDLALINANIYTADTARPKARVMVVKGGKIASVGNEIPADLPAPVRRLDAKGATVIPGFIDSHGHMRGLGDSLNNLDLREAKSAEEAARLVAEAARGRKAGEWILGRGWDQTRWPGQQFPSADQLPSTHPVYLTRVDGHAGWANRKALELADINAATADPGGGRIIRDSAGRPTGVLIDRAQGLVTRKIPPASREQIRERLARAARECARLGLTSVHDAGTGAEELAAYRELIAAGKLPMRVYAMIRGEGSLWEEYLKRGPEIGGRLTVRSIKLMGDGALGSRGAALKADYADEAGNRGLLILQQSDIERVARAAVRAGLQVNTHAIGDRGNRTVLDGYAAALGGPNNHRFRVEHAQVVSLADMEMFKKYSVIASMQATHATSDMRWAAKRVGEERVLGAYAWQRFLKLGVVVANGSDFPVEDPNPLWGFYSSITRQDHDGSPHGGWMPDQKMSREEALHSWTAAGAYAAFEEKSKGTLSPGKLADFVVLSSDIMQVAAAEILKARVTMTVLGGEIVYSE